jgi:hypothetical protein
MSIVGGGTDRNSLAAHSARKTERLKEIRRMRPFAVGVLQAPLTRALIGDRWANHRLKKSAAQPITLIGDRPRNKSAAVSIMASARKSEGARGGNLVLSSVSLPMDARITAPKAQESKRAEYIVDGEGE